MPVDDNYTVSLLHFNGADASTTFTDESGKAWTANGNAQIDTAQSVFGGASGLFDGTGDYITTPDSADFDVAGGNFTVDLWVRFNSLAATATVFSHRTDGNNVHRLTVSTAGKLQYEVYSAGVAIVSVLGTNGDVTTATWYHIALVRNGTSWVIYKNGVSAATATDADSVPNYTGTFQIGAENGATTLNGWMDEFRFSKGIARWTTGFTPPSIEYSGSGFLMMF